jgi:MFS family permease
MHTSFLHPVVAAYFTVPVVRNQAGRRSMATVSGALTRLGERPINRNFARLFYGQAVSAAGTVAFNTTVALWVAAVLGRGQSWSPLALGGVTACAGAAALLVGPVAGVFVDRWDRRCTMLRADLARAVLCLVLTGVAMVPAPVVPLAARLVLICLLAFGINGVDQFFGLARTAVLAEVLESDAGRARGLGLEQATSGISSMLAPPLATPLLFAFGAQWALLANTASYLFSYAFIRTMRIAPRGPAAPVDRASYRAQYLDGIRLFFASRTLVPIAGLALATQVAVGALTCLDLFFLTDNLHHGPHLYGFLAAAFGAGGIAGALAAGRTVARLGARGATWLSLLAAGVTVVLYARQTAWIPALVLLAASGVAFAVTSTAGGSLLLAAAPPDHIGRIFAVVSPILQLGWLASAAASGWLASTAMRHVHVLVLGLTVTRIDALFTIAGTLIVATGLVSAFLLPRSPRCGTPT